MWIKTDPRPRAGGYPPPAPKWHFIKELDTSTHHAYTACGLKLATMLMATSSMRETKPTRALLCKKCKNVGE